MLPYLSLTDPAQEKVHEEVDALFKASKATNDRALQIIRRNFHHSQRFSTLSPPRRSFCEQLNGTQILTKKSKVTLIPKNRDFHNQKRPVIGQNFFKSQRIKLVPPKASPVRIPTSFHEQFHNLGTRLSLENRLRVTQLKPLS